jgi:hypothetical protein
MSALGQKLTCAMQKGMSALPPKADNSPATFDQQHREGTLEPNGSIGIVRSKRIAMQPLR